MNRPFKPLLLPVLMIVGLIRVAFAYIGPGTGLSAIGAFLAVIASVAVSIFGFFWYPIKRLLGKNKKNKNLNQSWMKNNSGVFRWVNYYIGFH